MTPKAQHDLSFRMNAIMVVACAWMFRSSEALGYDSYYCLGMDAVVIGLSLTERFRNFGMDVPGHRTPLNMNVTVA